MPRPLLVLLAMFSCSPSVVLAAAEPPTYPLVKPSLANTQKTSGLKTESTSKPPGKSLPGKPKPEAEVSAPKPGNQPVNSKSDVSGSDRRKQLDRLSYEAVTNFFQKEGIQQFGLAEPGKEIKLMRISPDPDFSDRRIVAVQQQTVQGIPIFGARSTLEFSEQKGVVKRSGTIVPNERLRSVGAVPAISWTEAIDRAMESYRSSGDSRSTARPNEERCAIKIQLKVFDPAQLRLKTGSARLAWYVRVKGFVVFIDAKNGSPIFHYNDIQSTFSGRRTYDADNDSQDQCFENLVLDENGPGPGAPLVSPDPNNDARNAHAVAKQAYDFFKQLGWDSYDNQGSFINSCIRAKDQRNRYGQWDPDTKCMIFYPGLPSAHDIAGHEFTHGVIQSLPGLIYHGESGALNEALADFFGSQVENRNWTIGENVPMDSSDLQPPSNALPLRDMANPHKGMYSTTPCPQDTEPRSPGFYPNCPPWQWNQGQPDHYAELVDPEEHDICAYLAGGDNGCIHLNSGIFNKAMYLAANGGDHHDMHVNGIKAKKLSRIMFRTLAILADNSDLKMAARNSVESCTDLIGRSQIKQADCDQVRNAFVAVGLLSH